MREKLANYVELLFAGAPQARDIQQEILQNTLDRYDDLIAQGKAPEAACQLAICGIGDIHELLGDTPSPAVLPASPAAPKKGSKDRKYTAIAVMLYILCCVPVILFGTMGLGTVGVALMFLMVAAATGLLILQGSGPKEAKSHSVSPRQELNKGVGSLIGILGVGIYLVVSFATSAWYITWLIFPIMAAVKGLVRAILDLKEAGKNEK